MHGKNNRGKVREEFWPLKIGPWWSRLLCVCVADGSVGELSTRVYKQLGCSLKHSWTEVSYGVILLEMHNNTITVVLDNISICPGVRTFCTFTLSIMSYS